MNREDALKAIKTGAVAALISGTLTLIIILIAINTDSSDETISYFNDPWLLLDIIIIFSLAFFIWRKSRIAAIMMFVYFLISKIVIAIEAGKVSGIFISVLFLWFFVQAARGTFAWHKLEKAENPNYKTSKKWVLWLGGIVAAVFIGLMGLGIAVSAGYATATAVQTGKELPKNQRKKLLEADIIRSDEAIRFYYSQGLIDVTYGGAVMTDQRIIGYWSEEGKVRKQTLSYDLKDLDYLQLTEDGGALTDAVYQIAERGNHDESLLIVLSTESDRHLEMIEALQKQIAENNLRAEEATD